MEGQHLQKWTESACRAPTVSGPRPFFQEVPEGKRLNRVHLDLQVGQGRVVAGARSPGEHRGPQAQGQRRQRWISSDDG
jgi:hypothetical protein